MTKKILLIDVDDTILDFTLGETVAIRNTLNAFGLECNDNIVREYHSINDSLWKKYERGEIAKPDLLVERFRLLSYFLNLKNIDADFMNRVYFDNLKIQSEYKTGASEFLDKISPYYRIVLVTNGSTVVQNSRLKLSNLINRAERVFISEQLGTKKPERKFFDIVSSELPDFSIKDCVLAGDSLTSDILGGNNYGITTVWYNDKNKPTNDAIIPDYTVKSFDELYDLLISL